MCSGTAVNHYENNVWVTKPSFYLDTTKNKVFAKSANIERPFYLQTTVVINNVYEFELANSEVFNSSGFIIAKNTSDSSVSLSLLDKNDVRGDTVGEVVEPKPVPSINSQSSIESSKGNSKPEEDVLKLLKMKESLHPDLVAQLLAGFMPKPPTLASSCEPISTPVTNDNLIKHGGGNGTCEEPVVKAPVNTTITDVKGIRKDFVKDVTFVENKENIEPPSKRHKSK